MPLNWLCYRHNSDFTEGHELDRKSVERIFKFLGKPESATLAAELEAQQTIDQIFARADALPAGEESDSAYSLRAGERPGAQAPLDHPHRDVRPRRELAGMHQIAAGESVF